MKKNDIKDAFSALKADVSLKEKIMLRAEEDIDRNDTPEFEIGEMSHIKIKKGGGTRKAANALLAAAAVVAAVFSLRFFIADNIEYPNEGGSKILTAVSEEEPLPPDTAEIPVKVWDENGMLLKNLRIDYFPIKLDVPEADGSSWGGWSGGSPVFDEEHSERTGTISVTYEDEQKIRLHYGTYFFIVSDALPNDTFRVCNTSEKTKDGRVILDYGYAGNSAYLHDPAMKEIDENTSAIELTVHSAFLKEAPSDLPAEIILNGANGEPLQDWTVILKPVSGEMADGYSDIYGGYVLPRTDKNGSSVWKRPIAGEYAVIAYKERLHTAETPITKPFIFDGDNAFSYVKKEGDLTTVKIYRQKNGTE